MLNKIMCTDKSGTVRPEMCIKKINSMVLDILLTYQEAVFSTHVLFQDLSFNIHEHPTPTSLKANLGYCDGLDNLTYILGC